MRIVSPGTRYRRDVKRLGRRGYDIEQLTPDWLLIYQVDDREVRLFRTGCHSDLFR